MTKALPIVGILGAVFAALLIIVLADAATWVALVVLLAGSAVLLGQRTIGGTVAGLAIFVLTAVAAFGLTESISTKNGSLDIGVSYESGLLLALLACLGLPVAATVLRWDEAEPKWLAITGLACAASTLVLAVTDQTRLADHGSPRAVVTAVLALASMAPMVQLLRMDDDAKPAAPAPLASADAPLKARDASRPAPGAPPRPPAGRP